MRWITQGLRFEYIEGQLANSLSLPETWPDPFVLIDAGNHVSTRVTLETLHRGTHLLVDTATRGREIDVEGSFRAWLHLGLRLDIHAHEPFSRGIFD